MLLSDQFKKTQMQRDDKAGVQERAWTNRSEMPGLQVITAGTTRRLLCRGGIPSLADCPGIMRNGRLAPGAGAILQQLGALRRVCMPYHYWPTF